MSPPILAMKRKPKHLKRVLLDTNVWRYIADADAENDLSQVSVQKKLSILIAPAVVSETRDLHDIATRNRILKIVSNPHWCRMMPEAFSESQELKTEIRRLRPHWLRTEPDLVEENRLRHDWVRRTGGFWDRVRDQIDPPLTDESLRSRSEQELARKEATAIRQKISTGSQTGAKTKLQDVAGLPPSLTPGWNGKPVEYWRIPSLICFQKELLIYASPYREWLDGEIDIGALLTESESFNRLWLHELDSRAVPRQWLRGAFEFLQAWHRVTPGTPVDAQMSTHLVEADYFVSADKNFVRFAQRCYEESPFSVAMPQLISGGNAGVADLLHFLKTI